MPSLQPSSPTHLSIFVTNPDSGHPAAWLPLYAEVALPRIIPQQPISDRFFEPMRGALADIDPTATGLIRDRIEEAARQAMGQTITEESLKDLILQPQHVRELFQQVFKEVLATSDREHMADIPPADLNTLLISAIRRVGAEMGLSLVPEVKQTGVVWAEPLGVLTTDHVGYASFDLKRLRPEVQVMLAEAIEARRNDPDAVSKLSIWIYPYGYAGKFDAFSQARFAFDAIVARLTLEWHTLPPALVNMGPRALQNPGLTDWRLSPASFAASPKTLVGDDGCEELVPANLALQEFVLRQVVRVSDPPAGLAIPDAFKFAYVDDYKVTWFSLGYSLGEILYSLPLAPAESVKLAVIDWSWDSLSKRDEQTTLTEEVLHQTHRDRTITETIKAGLKELQHGSSFMGGAAGSSGATGSYGTGAMGAGAAVGNTWSLGGSTATSDGSRDLAAENVQRLSDSFSQASSAQRELNSTVVIQARQEEKESIQTRTFTNYNHSHTLTILYYEVLRHYRVTVEWVRRRNAVLVKLPASIATFDAKTVLSHRFQLESALLDQSLKGAFGALEKQESIRAYQTAQGITASDAWVAPYWEGNEDISMFELGIDTHNSAEASGDDTSDSPVVCYVVTVGDEWDSKRYELQYVYKGNMKLNEDGNAPHNLNSGQRFNEDGFQWIFTKIWDVGAGNYITVKWKDIVGFQFEKWGDDDWRIDHLAINAFGQNGWFKNLTEGIRDVDLYFLSDEPSSNSFTWLLRPGAPPPMLPPANRAPEKSLTAEEGYQISKLLDHFQNNKDYYNRILLLATDPTTIALQFESKAWTAGQTLDDHADPDPLEVFGSYVAYPLAKKANQIDDTLVVDIAAALNGNDPARRQWALDKLAAMPEADSKVVMERVALASAKSERLITLPTRGVFAEGKLGHCSVSEEIENMRFWKWEEHPIPFEAPGINPVTPIQPQPQQVSVTPTAFPQSLVNIVNPSTAPDPTGLGAALSLLGTPNIFRDMSGRQEVADLLKKLSDNTISIAEAANHAREIQTKYGTDLDKQQKDYDLGTYKAAADVTGKAIEAETQRNAQAQASKSEAEAKKANVDAATQQAEAAKSLPKPLRDPVYKDAANALAGNPTKNKVVVFKALGYNGQILDGEFGLAVRDVEGQKDVIAENKVGPYFDRAISFSVADPVVEARARRVGTASIKIFDEVITLPAIDIVPRKESYTVGKSHKVINLTLTQTSREVSFKAKSTNSAVDELMNKWGVELGVDKVVAAKLVADYEKKHQITHATEEEKSYSFNVPTQNYELIITSK